MSRALALWPLLIFLVCPSLVQAETVTNLYEATVPVIDRSEAELNTAAQDGLRQVLVKVTGSADNLENPTLEAAMPGARRLVQQYTYLQRPGPEQGLAARLYYEAAQIEALVKRAGAPLWTANRPSVLVWLVIEDDTGRQFVSADLQPELAATLTEGFDHRGVPSQLPLLDLADAAALPAGQAWRLNAVSLRGASARYGVSEILAGRVAKLSTGAWVGDWSYFSAGQRLDRSVTSNSAESFIERGVNLVAEDLAARYAVAASAGATGGLSMLVEGVEVYADYANVISWLERLELVEHANVERIQGDSIIVRVHAQLDAAQLASLVALNSSLRPLERHLSEADLGYRWQN